MTVVWIEEKQDNFRRCPYCLGQKGTCLDCNGAGKRCIFCLEPPGRCECPGDRVKVERV